MESIKKNIFYQSVYQVLVTLLPLVTSPYLSRVIGADGVGIYSYTYAVVSYFVIFAKLGLHLYGNRCIASVSNDQEKLNQTFCDLYSLHLVIAGISAVAYTGYIFFCGGEYKFFLMIQGLYLVAQILDINWFFFGLEKFKITVTRNTVIKVLTVTCIFIFVREKTDITKYIFILAFGSALSESIIWGFVGRYIKFVKPRIKAWKEHILPMAVFFIPSIAVSVYKMMDKIMLGIMSNTVQVGLYENSEKIITICLGFVTAVGTVMLPRMTSLVVAGRAKEGDKIIEKSSKFILILSYALCFGIIGVSATFPTLFWGSEFSACTALMFGLALSLPFTAIANVIRTQYLIPKHRDKSYVMAVCFGAVINLAVNAICIPRMEAMGAVIGTIAAEVSVCLIQLGAARKEVPVMSFVAWSKSFAIIGIIMSVFVYFMGRILGIHLYTLILQIGVGAIFYILCAAIYLYLKRDEIFIIMKSILKRNR